MQKNIKFGKSLEDWAMGDLSDPLCDVGTKKWLVECNINSQENLVKAAMMNSLPSVSIAAFSKMRDEQLKASTIISMFSNGDGHNMVLIGYSVIRSMGSTKLLWDILQAKGTPRELKQHIEIRIGELSGTAEEKDYSSIIRADKS